MRACKEWEEDTEPVAEEREFSGVSRGAGVLVDELEIEWIGVTSEEMLVDWEGGIPGVDSAIAGSSWGDEEGVQRGRLELILTRILVFPVATRTPALCG